MPIVDVIQQNWVGGELSPNMRGRFDLPVYASGAEKIVNFLSEAPGAARYRNGTTYVNNTRRNHVACLVPFQFNSEQSYLLEFTEGFIRFYRNNGILVTGNKTITAATKANPGVITAVAHGYSTGDEVIISGVSGMTQLNNRSFVITVLSVDTFSIQDQFGSNVNTTAYTTYSSGGISQKILEVVSPYLEADLFALKVGQNADTMYIVHRYYEPRKLTRASATSWSLAIFARTADPFTAQKAITGVTQASPGNVTAVGHGYSTGQSIIIETVGGMTQLNGRRYTIIKTGADNFTLLNPDGTAVDTTGYGAYSANGYASDQTLLPAAIAFYQGRLLYGYSDTFTQSFWGSKALDASGNPQYDNMTTGTNPADGFKFTLSPSTTGKVDKIQSLFATTSFLGIGTFEGIFKADGGTTGEAITPSNINVVPAGTFGVKQQITPILNGSSLLFIHRSGIVLFSLEFNIISNSYDALDKTLSYEHITVSGIQQMFFVTNRPSMFWMIRGDGKAVGITYLSKENVNGAHRHTFGGTSAKVLSGGPMPRDDAYDQSWFVVERVINGHTVRYVEYINDVPNYPEFDDFYTGDDNEVTDMATWRNAMFEAQKQGVHVDAALIFDGSDLGADANVSVTPGAVTGTGITFTASNSIFTAAMVGRQIWKKAINGVGTGRATITAYVSATQVTCTVLTDFNSVAAMAAGNWYLTTAAIQGAWHLEGELVSVVTDGGVHASQTVSSGAIALQYQSSVVVLGEPYYGLLKSMNLEAGGTNGVAQTKPKNINHLDIRFLNTLGARFGSSLYTMEAIPFRDPNDSTGRPPPLFTGVKPMAFEDSTSRDKHVYIQQIDPLPCTVLCAVPFVDTDNAG